jgi:hypothetical protein
MPIPISCAKIGGRNWQQEHQQRQTSPLLRKHKQNNQKDKKQVKEQKQDEICATL